MSDREPAPAHRAAVDGILAVAAGALAIAVPRAAHAAENRLKRVTREYKDIQRDPPSRVGLGPVDPKDMFKWKGVISMLDAPYDGGVFELEIFFPTDYPAKPPKVKFLTRIYHPNVNDKGAICLDVLKSGWSSSLDIGKVMIALVALLADPDPDDALVPDIARLYKTNRKEFDRTAQEWTKKYATR